VAREGDPEAEKGAAKPGGTAAGPGVGEREDESPQCGAGGAAPHSGARIRGEQAGDSKKDVKARRTIIASARS
jgi:hypothetical protein